MCLDQEVVAISSQCQGHNGFREMTSYEHKHSILMPSKLTGPYNFTQTSHNVLTPKLLKKNRTHPFLNVDFDHLELINLDVGGCRWNQETLKS